MLTLTWLLFTATISISFDDFENYHCPSFEALDKKIDATNGVRVNLTDAMNNNGATCLDGSVPVMYYRSGTGSGVNKFHVFFEGGGWCGGITTQLSKCQDTCVHRSGTTLGSSKTYPDAANYDNGYMSTSQTTNPLSYDWNTIYVKYCDGASFSGNNDTTETSGSVTLHWRGWRILNGVFTELDKNYNWAKATDVLISGCSAGGLTTWLHSQHIYDSYVKPLGINNFLSMPDSGFFLEWEGSGKYISAMQWLYNYQNTSSALNKACMAANKGGNEYKCMFAQETAPYEGFKMFPLQSRFDSWQQNCELSANDPNDMNKYGANITTNFENMYIKSTNYGSIHAGFLDSCSHHCGEWNVITIDGMKSSQAQFQFYYDNNTHNKFWFQDQTYPCHNCCS